MKNSNHISIRQYLDSKSIYPAKEREYYGMYHSPFREDANPSFKVDYQKDLWYDFGADEGGSIIDLVMKVEQCTLAEAFRIADNSFSFQQNTPVTPTNQEQRIKILSTTPLIHPALLNYLSKQRCIAPDIAKHYCSEVHYSIAGKPYFAIGFKNDAGGWELRNAWFKGSSTPKSITTINNNSDTVMVFEGFIDFLSYLSLKGSPSPRINTTVLNSVANLRKAIPFLKTHKTVHAFLDNDEAGRKSLANLHDLLPDADVVDQTAFYRNYKDLSDYWQAKAKSKENAAEQIKRQIPTKKKGLGL